MRNSLTPLLAVATLAAALSGCSQRSRQHAADERLSAIYSSEWQWRTDQLPDDEDATRPVADHLPRVDPATQDMRRKYWEDVLRRVDGAWKIASRRLILDQNVLTAKNISVFF